MIELKSARMNKARSTALITATRGITIKISTPSKATLAALIGALETDENLPAVASTEACECKAVILVENRARIEIKASEREALLAALEVFPPAYSLAVSRTVDILQRTTAE